MISEERWIMSENRHPGINMHKLPVGGGLIGLLFALGSAVIFILGFPTLWYFVAFSAGLGVLIALMIKFVRERTSNRNKPLSILSEQKLESHPRAHRQKWHRVFQTMPHAART
jgi:hypothetical protein